MNIISRKEAESQGLKRYYTGEKCNRGHMDERYVASRACLSCRELVKKPKITRKKPQCRKEYMRLYRIKNKDKISVQSKDYREKNREARKEYLSKNEERFKAYNKRYKTNNPLQTFTRNSLRRIEVSKSKTRRSIAECELGYTQKQFKTHIENLFLDGMSWDNRSEWHIDHIVPVSWWLKNGITDVSIINDLLNLQPLWIKDNLTKSDKLI